MYLVRKIDGWLNGITMYRLVAYVLGVYAALGISFSLAGVLSFSGVGLVVSLALALACCFLANLVLSWVWNVPTNSESWLITALILFCVMQPATTSARIAGVIVASCAAMAGKFLLAVHGKHLFNPAALGATVAGLVGLAYAGWWIGTPAMLPFVVIGGLLITRKVRRFTMVGSAIAAAVAMMIVVSIMHGQPVAGMVKILFLSWPILFFATVMLTEPSTIPPRKMTQVLYAIITGLLFSAQLHYGMLSTSPHMVLLVGNIFAFVVGSKGRMLLTLQEKQQSGSSQVFDYRFSTAKPVAFKAGQYIEWTLPHNHPDDRGNRRTFSIASSPTEKDVHLGVKFYTPSSSYKRALHDMEPGQEMWAGHVAGDFVLPGNQHEKLLWIAGGIGITPFRSMAQYIIDTKQQRDIVLLYAVNNVEELVFMDVFARAETCGLHVIPVLGAGKPPAGWKGQTGMITEEMIAKQVPDYRERRFYLSGPNAMVNAFRSMVMHMGVARRRIVTDFFSGY